MAGVALFFLDQRPPSFKLGDSAPESEEHKNERQIMIALNSMPKEILKMEQLEKARPKTNFRKEGHGAYEWAPVTFNCCTGCSNDCLYCYAKGMAVRFKQVTPAEWFLQRIRPWDVNKKHKKYDGWVMFPSSYDITPSSLEA